MRERRDGDASASVSRWTIGPRKTALAESVHLVECLAITDAATRLKVPHISKGDITFPACIINGGALAS